MIFTTLFNSIKQKNSISLINYVAMLHYKILTTFLFTIFSSIIFSQTTTLEKLNTYDIGNNVEEPSGLAFDGEFLYTVCDNTTLIYKYNTNGIFQKAYETNLKNLEGITDFGNNIFLLAVESSNTLVTYNLTDKSSREYPMAFKNKNPSKKSGIEGVTFNPKNNSIYFLNEKKPGALIVVNSTTFKVTDEYKLDFAKDYSGMFFTAETNELWIISDKEGLVYRTTLTGKVIETMNPNIAINDKLEGIAIDYPSKLLYLVTDKGQHLIKYRFKTENWSRNSHSLFEEFGSYKNHISNY